MENDDHSSEDEYRHVIERLRAFASAPLADGIRDRARGPVKARPARVSRGRAKWLIAGSLAGFMAGSVGLAAADVLPAPVQDVAHNALDTVGVHVPPGHQRFNDPATCPGGPYANHGAYVRTHHDDPNAGSSPCGKPLQAVDPSQDPNSDGQPGNQGKGNKADDTNPGNGKGHGKGASQGEGHGQGHGEGTGDALKQHGEGDDNTGTHSDEPTVPATTSTSMPAQSAVSTTSTTTTTVAAPTTTAPTSPTT